MSERNFGEGHGAAAGAAAGGGAPGGAAVRLEKRTYLDSGKWKITLRNFGDGLAEIGWSFISSVRPGQAGKGFSEEREENQNRAVRRARSKIRHLILAIGADHLLTLTYRENVTDFNRACADLSKFVRRMKAKLPGWQYVAVAEQQQRGAWHWHMAVRGRQDVALLRSTWRHIVREGNIDVNPPRGVGKQRTLALVKYLGIGVTLFDTLCVPWINFGRRRVYDRIDLDAWLDEYKRRGRARKETLWPVKADSTGGETRASGGSMLHYRTASVYAKALGLKTEKKR